LKKSADQDFCFGDGRNQTAQNQAQPAKINAVLVRGFNDDEVGMRFARNATSLCASSNSYRWTQIATGR
jgi:hypothetical protein